MKRSTVLSMAALAAVASVSVIVLSGRGRQPVAAPRVARADPAVLAAGPGRVEPISEEVSIGAPISGTLQAVLVEEGDRVQAGQILAVLENRDYRARVASAEAELAVKEADLRRVINGARQQERREAAATVAEAEAVLNNARLEWVRRQHLWGDGVIAREDADRAYERVRVAEARADAARERHDLIEADAREEDQTKAESDVALARARLEEARAVYEKTFVRAPLSAVILRRHRKPGESVSTQFDSPIVTLADRSQLRVRVDVDEADVGKVAVGQRVYVTADAFGATKFWGRVVRVGQVLGKKNVRTDEPVEKVDTKILEALVQLDGLDGGFELPLGLRVQAFVVGENVR